MKEKKLLRLLTKNIIVIPNNKKDIFLVHTMLTTQIILIKLKP